MDRVDWIANLGSQFRELAGLTLSFIRGSEFGAYDEGWFPGCGLSYSQFWEMMMACDDCGDPCIGDDTYYMVRDDVWLEAGAPLSPERCMLCPACLSLRLGRPLLRTDFTDCPLNRETFIPAYFDSSDDSI